MVCLCFVSGLLFAQSKADIGDLLDQRSITVTMNGWKTTGFVIRPDLVMTTASVPQALVSFAVSGDIRMSSPVWNKGGVLLFAAPGIGRMLPKIIFSDDPLLLGQSVVCVSSAAPRYRYGVAVRDENQRLVILVQDPLRMGGAAVYTLANGKATIRGVILGANVQNIPQAANLAPVPGLAGFRLDGKANFISSSSISRILADYDEQRARPVVYQ